MTLGDSATLRRIAAGGKGALCLGLLAGPLAAQAPVHWSEVTRTSVTVGNGAAERARTLVREAGYEVTRRADTLVVQVTSLVLREMVAGQDEVRHDTDGFVGGRWKLLADSSGTMRVVDAPFVPEALADVSDLARIIEDVLPPAPPALAERGSRALPGGWTWHRDADLPGVRRYRWTVEQEADSTRVVADSTEVRQHERVDERGSGDWDAAGARAWTRHVETTTEGRFAGRVVRARAVTDVAVRREG